MGETYKSFQLGGDLFREEFLNNLETKLKDKNFTLDMKPTEQPNGLVAYSLNESKDIIRLRNSDIINGGSIFVYGFMSGGREKKIDSIIKAVFECIPEDITPTGYLELIPEEYLSPEYVRKGN